MRDDHPRPGRWTRLPAAGQGALLAAGYLLATVLAVGLTQPEGHLITFRPSVGLVLVALLTTERRRWPVLLLATAAAGALYRAVEGYDPGPSAAFIVAEVISVTVAASVSRLVVPETRLDLTRVRNAVGMATGLIAGLLMGSAVGAVLDRELTGHIRAHTWVDWPMASGLGMLVVVPLAAAIAARASDRAPIRRPREAVAAVTVTAAIALVGYGATDLPVTGVIVLALVWGAIRSGLCAAASATALLSVIVMAMTTHGHGMYTAYGSSAHDAVLAAQLALISVALVMTGVAALVVERLHAQQALRRHEAQLRDRHRLETLGTVAAGVAHDFNNMLAIVRGHAERALEETTTDGDPRPALEELLRGVDTSGAVAQQLVSFSRDRPTPRQPVYVGRLVEDVSELVAPVLPPRISVQTEIDRDARHACVMADATQVQQALFNLVLNARDAMPAGGCVTLAVLARDDLVALEVRDTGTGMDDVTWRRAATRGFTTKASGSGLGLANVAAICRRHEGELEIDTVPGVGTTVRLTLPRCDPHAAAIVDRPSGLELERGTETVLLAEDNEHVRALMRIALSDSGYRLLEARDGRQALELVDEHGDDIDLLVSDVTMPGLDGPEVVRRVRETGRDMRVLFVSGAAEIAPEPDDVHRDEVLVKPFGLGELAEKVREVLDRPSGR